MMWDMAASFVNGGWTPYSERTREQKRMTDEFHDRIGSFELVGTMISDIPDRLIMAEVELKVLGKLIPKIHQLSGSCVGAGGANAYVNAMLGDVVHRNSREEVKQICPWPTYGKGRQLGGMRRPGEGSFGGAQARACDPDNFGYLPWDFPGMPKPRKMGDKWWSWSSQTEIKWSHPSSWPISERELALEAAKFGIHNATRSRSLDETINAQAQGYGVTLASSYGYSPRVKGDYLIGVQNRTWNHQMSGDGYALKTPYGRLWKIKNQWNDVHGKCPTASEFGDNGTFWIEERDAEKHHRNGEVYIHTNTGDFPGREFRWTEAATFVDD